jgi:glycosyltransferase involved in cell wall biosynthesis
VNTPLKLLDYMKAGRAIVATDTEANRLLLDESNAVLAAAEPKSFAAGVCELLGDRDRRLRLGEAARRRIDDCYNYGEFKRRLGACYEQVLGAGTDS